MLDVTGCGLSVLSPAYVVFRGDTSTDVLSLFAVPCIQSARVNVSKLSSLVSLSKGGSPNTRVWLYSYCTDSSTCSRPGTIGPPIVTRGVQDSMPRHSPPRRRGRGSRSFTVTSHASPAFCVSTTVTAPADNPNSGA